MEQSDWTIAVIVLDIVTTINIIIIKAQYLYFSHGREQSHGESSDGDESQRSRSRGEQNTGDEEDEIPTDRDGGEAGRPEENATDDAENDGARGDNTVDRGGDASTDNRQATP